MNYKANCHQELKEFSKDTPEYTFGDILFSVLKSVAPGRGSSMAFLRDITDEEYFTLIEKTREKEKKE
jgi:hypothetical protein